MSLSKDVDLEEFVMANEDLSGADIKAVLRVTKAHFTAARKQVS